jgi:hypothetical protein
VPDAGARLLNEQCFENQPDHASLPALDALEAQPGRSPLARLVKKGNSQNILRIGEIAFALARLRLSIFRSPDEREQRSSLIRYDNFTERLCGVNKATYQKTPL